MSQPGENHQLALDRFLNEHPALAAELNTLNPLAAQAKGKPSSSTAPSACMKRLRLKPSSKACLRGS